MSAEPQYDLTPLMAEIELVIKEGVHKIVKKQLKRNRLLEKTHRKIMKLPSVLKELKRMNVQVVAPPKEEDWIQIMLERLNTMEERYAALTRQQLENNRLLNDMQNKLTNNIFTLPTLTGEKRLTQNKKNENTQETNDVKKIYVKEEKIDVKEVHVKKEEVKEEPVEEVEEQEDVEELNTSESESSVDNEAETSDSDDEAHTAYQSILVVYKDLISIRPCIDMK
jgi:hypothetical protein